MLLKTILCSILLLITSCDKANKSLTTQEFLKNSNETLKKENISAGRASWVQSNFITDDTTAISSEYNAKYSALATEIAIQSKNFTGKTDDEKRMLSLLLRVLTVPAPNDNKLNEELSTLKSELESMYGSGKYCKSPKDCKTLGDLEKVIAKSRDPKELLDAWDGWHSIAKPMKEKYIKTVEIGNKGANELGFSNMADLWRSNYDMKPEDFEKELDRIWDEVKPFYEQLHCYVRGKLNKKYGSDVVDLKKPIPAHLLGNMWAQSWDNLTDVLDINNGQSLDITKLITAAKFDSKKMVQTAENFFVSLGMPKLPESFYQKSLFEKPRDREVVCHASAWHIDMVDDVRIKMCIEIDEDNFRTIHHELGHIYYYLAYKDLAPIYQNSANDGFHEALGDTIELSITGQYLKDIKLLNEAPQDNKNVNQTLLKMALGKVAFLPFGLMIDKYRWQIFDGRTTPENYNKDWWKLRTQYQGIQAPNDRPADAFDPGAKYHIPAYTPYSRYFIAHILQFQFHRALCQAAGHTGPLHECSIFKSQAAGDKLWKMMKLGNSKEWPEALKTVTGQEKMDASALREYFSPLEKWLIEQNKDKTCGW
jgi:peptidyl-dipeptidase A